MTAPPTHSLPARLWSQASRRRPGEGNIPDSRLRCCIRPPQPGVSKITVPTRATPIAEAAILRELLSKKQGSEEERPTGPPKNSPDSGPPKNSPDSGPPQLLCGESCEKDQCVGGGGLNDLDAVDEEGEERGELNHRNIREEVLEQQGKTSGQTTGQEQASGQSMGQKQASGHSSGQTTGQEQASRQTTGHSSGQSTSESTRLRISSGQVVGSLPQGNGSVSRMATNRSAETISDEKLAQLLQNDEYSGGSHQHTLYRQDTTHWNTMHQDTTRRFLHQHARPLDQSSDYLLAKHVQEQIDAEAALQLQAENGPQEQGFGHAHWQHSDAGRSSGWSSEQNDRTHWQRTRGGQEWNSRGCDHAQQQRDEMQMEPRQNDHTHWRSRDRGHTHWQKTHDRDEWRSREHDHTHWEQEQRDVAMAIQMQMEEEWKSGRSDHTHQKSQEQRDAEMAMRMQAREGASRWSPKQTGHTHKDYQEQKDAELALQMQHQEGDNHCCHANHHYDNNGPGSPVYYRMGDGGGGQNVVVVYDRVPQAQRRFVEQIQQEAAAAQRIDMTYESLLELEDVRHGVDADTLERITSTHTYQDRPGTSEENRTCLVCQTQYSPGDQLRSLPCMHMFHRSCVDKWLADHTQCPVCMKDIKEHKHTT